MRLERIEEGLLTITAAALLSYLAPFTPGTHIALTVIIALFLIGLLILRSIAWHKDGVTPFDGIMVIGIGLTIAYLASFAAFTQTAANLFVLLLFACFYAMLAVMLFQHRTPAHPRVRQLRRWKVNAARHARRESQGLTPLPERAPPWENESWLKRTFNLDAPKPGWQKPNREPLPEMKTPALGKVHDASFKQGIEPIPEITPEHLHRMGVYDAEPRRRK